MGFGCGGSCGGGGSNLILFLILILLFSGNCGGFGGFRAE